MKAFLGVVSKDEEVNYNLLIRLAPRVSENIRNTVNA